MPKFTALTCPNGCLGPGVPFVTTSKMRVEEALPCEDIPVLPENIGPIASASAGPGTLAIYFFGKKVTANKPV